MYLLAGQMSGPASEQQLAGMHQPPYKNGSIQVLTTGPLGSCRLKNTFSIGYTVNKEKGRQDVLYVCGAKNSQGLNVEHQSSAAGLVAS